MEENNKLMEFGLTKNQAELLKFFIESKDRNSFTYKQIKEQFHIKSHFYRELLDDLVNLKFLEKKNKSKPFIYIFKENRLDEIISEAQNLFLSSQQNYDDLLNGLNNIISNKMTLRNLLKFLQSAQVQLNLNEDQVLILYNLFSHDDGTIQPNYMTIEQIFNKIKKSWKKTENIIRYNLNLLKDRGFVNLKRIGRVNNYYPKDLTTLIKNEKDFQKKVWDERCNRLIEIKNYFLTESTNDYILNKSYPEQINLLEFLKQTKNEVLIIFPLNKSNQNLININISKVLKIILNFIKSSNILIKILLNDFVKELNSEIIKQILNYLPQIEVRVSSNQLDLFVIVIDEAYSINMVGKSLELNLIQDFQTIKLYKKEFNNIWETAEDFRISLIQDSKLYQIFKDQITKSEKNFQIKPKNIEEYEFLNLGKNLNEVLKNYIEQTKEEVLLDFRGDIKRINIVEKTLDNFFNIIIEILKEKNIKIKLLFGIDSWIVNKLDKTFIQMIEIISSGKLEFRVPLENNVRNIRIIIDDSLYLQEVGNQISKLTYQLLLIRNKSRAEEAAKQFNQAWKTSLDLRDVIMEYSINKNLAEIAIESVKKDPPIYDFGKESIRISGKGSVLRVLLNLIRNAKQEVLILGNPFYISGEQNRKIFSLIFTQNYYDEYFKILYNKANSGINIKIIRNILKMDANYELNEAYKKNLSLLLSLFPVLQIRQIELTYSKFIIIDKKILIFYEFFESDQIRLLIFNENFLINKFIMVFQEIWDTALDIRLNWLSYAPSSIKKIIQESFDKVELQITLPEKGQMKHYDGIYLPNIIRYLLHITKKEIHIFLVSPDYFNPIISQLNQEKSATEKDIINKNFTFIIKAYSWDVIRAVKTRNIKARTILAFLPYYMKGIGLKELKDNLEIYPNFQVRFLPNKYLSNLMYGIYDNYLVLVFGDMASGTFQLLIINDINLSKNYLNQFEISWSNSVDSRQVYYEACSKRKRGLILESYGKYKLEREYTSKEIQEIFP